MDEKERLRLEAKLAAGGILTPGEESMYNQYKAQQAEGPSFGNDILGSESSTNTNYDIAQGALDGLTAPLAPEAPQATPQDISQDHLFGQPPMIMGSESNFNQGKAALNGRTVDPNFRAQKIEPKLPDLEIPGIPENLKTDKSNYKGFNEDKEKSLDLPDEFNEDLNGKGASYQDQLSQAAYMGNAMNAGLDINSSAHMFGKSLKGGSGAEKIASGVNLLFKTGKGVLGGMAYQKRNQFVQDEYERKQREAMEGDYNEASQAHDFGGNLSSAEDGGTIGDHNSRAFADALSMYMRGGQSSKTKLEDGGVSRPTYAAGDKITFKDEKGKVISGIIKGIKDGEIILED